MLSLLAKLGLDISGFTRGLDGAKTAAKRTTGEIAENTGKELGGLLKQWIGLGALAGFSAKKINEALKARDSAMLAGTTPSEELAKAEVLQRIGDAAAVTAEEFRRLVDVAKAGLPSDNALTALAENIIFMRENLKAGEKDAVGFLAAFGKVGRFFAKHGNAVDEALQSAAIRILTPAPNEKNGGLWARTKDAFGRMPDAYRNAVAGAEANYAATIEASKITPAPKPIQEAPAAAESKSSRAIGRAAFPTFDPRIAAGGLASAGLFFGGAGNPLLREAKSQTGILERSERELRGIRAAIREEL